jgi:BNR repeat-like domain
MFDRSRFFFVGDLVFVCFCFWMYSPDTDMPLFKGMLLAFNNSTRLRTPLTLAHSVDNGLSWEHIVDLETGPGQFAYPFVLQSKHDPNTAHVCYTYKPASGPHTIAYASIRWENQ